MVGISYLLDTNVLSEPLRKSPSNQVLEQIRTHQHAIATAAPAWHELRFGCRVLAQGRRRRDIETYLADLLALPLPILPYDVQASEWHAEERARLAKSGRPPAFIDGQIAAIAAIHGLTLITANVRDFARFDGLRVLDWAK